MLKKSVHIVIGGIVLNKNRTQIEVRYQETDQMGVVYHANYLVWFEIGRTKLLEQLGFKYADMERDGFVSPVLDARILYKKAVTYGDKVVIETSLKDYDGIRITYNYSIFNEKDDTLCVSGYTKHVLVHKDTFRPVQIEKINKDWHYMYVSQLKGQE